MEKRLIGDEEYSEEINTTYDQEQPIGDTPSDYPAGGAEPIDAMNAEQFYTIQRGGDKIGEFKGKPQQKPKKVFETNQDAAVIIQSKNASLSTHRIKAALKEALSLAGK